MKDQNFSIKISDLLNKAGSTDEIVFEKKFTAQIPGLTDKGISGTFVMQSLNDAALLATLYDVTCEVEDMCDSCQKAYVRTISIPEYVARFVSEDERTEEEKAANTEEELFLINEKSETINIEDMVVQAIMLQDPLVSRCAACEKKMDAQSDDDELPEFESRGNIVFS